MRITVTGLDPIQAALLAQRLAAVVPESATVVVESEQDKEIGLAPDTVVIRA